MFYRNEKSTIIVSQAIGFWYSIPPSEPVRWTTVGVWVIRGGSRAVPGGGGFVSNCLANGATHTANTGDLLPVIGFDGDHANLIKCSQSIVCCTGHLVSARTFRAGWISYGRICTDALTESACVCRVCRSRTQNRLQNFWARPNQAPPLAGGERLAREVSSSAELFTARSPLPRQCHRAMKRVKLVVPGRVFVCRACQPQPRHEHRRETRVTEPAIGSR